MQIAWNVKSYFLGKNKKKYFKMLSVEILLNMLSINYILPIATDRALFSSEKCWYLSYFITKTYVEGTH